MTPDDGEESDEGSPDDAPRSPASGDGPQFPAAGASSDATPSGAPGPSPDPRSPDHGSRSPADTSRESGFDAPSPAAIQAVFHTHEVRRERGRVYYFGHALVGDAELRQALRTTFADAGYRLSHVERAGEDVLVARPRSTGDDGIPWLNVVLFVATLCSTLVVGSMWFYVDPVQNPGQIWRGWPFAVGIMTVLGVHELGHYAMTRYHDVEATLPYFIPVPTLIGTMGAVIRMKGQMPDRKALFDIGVAGPVAGLVATVVVTLIGLHLDPVTAPASLAESGATYELALGFPPLLQFLAWLSGQPLYFDDPMTTVHPLVIAGWVGMLVTFLNLIPVGQFDGGHVLRAIAPEHQTTVAAVVPAVLYSLAGYLLLVQGIAARNVMIWAVWGTAALGLAAVGPATPMDDDTAIGPRRKLLGAATFLVGLACFTPVPIAVV